MATLYGTTQTDAEKKKALQQPYEGPGTYTAPFVPDPSQLQTDPTKTAPAPYEGPQYPTQPVSPKPPSTPYEGPGATTQGGTSTPYEGPWATTSPVPAPTAPVPPAPLTPSPTGIDPNQAAMQIASAFESQFGRAMTPEEQAALAQAVGYTGGDINQSMIDQALQLVSQYGGSMTPQQAPAPTETPVQGIDPQQALNQVNAAMQQRFGRDLTPAEVEQLRTQLLSDFPSLAQGGPITQEILDKALGYAASYSGNLANPSGQQPSQTVDSTIQAILNRGLNFDPNDPVFKGQTAAFERQSQRSAARKRAALAERAAARGTLGAGGYDVDTERILSEQGEANQAFEAALAGQELQKQRDQLMRVLELESGRISEREKNALAERLADLDAAIRREGLTLQKLLGERSLDIQESGQGIQNQQFYDQLGANVGLQEANLNQQAILALLGQI